MSTPEEYAKLERQWHDAHRAIESAYDRRDELGEQFWTQVAELEQKAAQLGRQLDLYRTAKRTGTLPVHITPAVDYNPRADTQEVPAACHVCGGIGEVTVALRGKVTYHRLPCSVCGGSGVLP